MIIYKSKQEILVRDINLKERTIEVITYIFERKKKKWVFELNSIWPLNFCIRKKDFIDYRIDVSSTRYNPFDFLDIRSLRDTINNVKDNEYWKAKNWLYENREDYNG